MTVLRNTNPLGAVDVPLIGREGDNGEYAEPNTDGYADRTPVAGSGCLEASEEFECAPAQARLLLAQPGNFAPVDDEAKQIAEELSAAAEHTDPGTGEPMTGTTTVPPGDTGEVSSPTATDEQVH